MSKKKVAPSGDEDLALVTWDPKTNRVFATSLTVAEHFGKRHGYVVAAIERHIREDQNDSRDVQRSLHIYHPDFDLFKGVDGQNRPLEMYAMTREGFMDVVVNFTGEKAREWKRRFRKAFSHYEAIARGVEANRHDPRRILQRQEGKTLRKDLTDVLIDLKAAIASVQREGSKASDHVFDLWTRMLQTSLFDRTIPNDAKLRDWLNVQQLVALGSVEMMLANYVRPMVPRVADRTLDYHEPYRLAKARVTTMVMFLGGPTKVIDLAATPSLDFGSEDDGRLAA